MQYTLMDGDGRHKIGDMLPVLNKMKVWNSFIGRAKEHKVTIASKIKAKVHMTVPVLPEWLYANQVADTPLPAARYYGGGVERDRTDIHPSATVI